MMNEAQIVELFRNKGFRATPQRIVVYKYLCENRTHPDADEIYKSVLSANPSFSKTTVYNSLQALEDEGFIIKINIDSDRVRYDAFTSLHGHFYCKSCKRIYDFDVNSINDSLQDGFDMSERNVYYSGLCPECK